MEQRPERLAVEARRHRVRRDLYGAHQDQRRAFHDGCPPEQRREPLQADDQAHRRRRHQHLLGGPPLHDRRREPGRDLHQRHGIHAGLPEGGPLGPVRLAEIGGQCRRGRRVLGGRRRLFVVKQAGPLQQRLGRREPAAAQEAQGRISRRDVLQGVVYQQVSQLRSRRRARGMQAGRELRGQKE